MGKYLVTGGCGFIGSHLVKHLLNLGHKIRILDILPVSNSILYDERVDLVQGDVTSFDMVQSCMFGIDGCFHLASLQAAESKNRDDKLSHHTNLFGAINVLEIAGKQKIPVVYASSSEVYGDNADWALHEHSKPNPLNNFSADKLSSELYAKVASLLYRNKVIGLRFFNVYGPTLKQSGKLESDLISSFVNRLILRKPLIIYGDGEQVRDFIYIDDVLKFLYAAMTSKIEGYSVFNVCSGKVLSINQLGRSLMSILDINLPIVHEPSRKRDIRGFVGDPSLAMKALGVSAQTKIADGLYKTINSSKDDSYFSNELQSIVI